MFRIGQFSGDRRRLQGTCRRLNFTRKIRDAQPRDRRTNLRQRRPRKLGDSFKLRIGTVRVSMQKFTRQIGLKRDHGQRMPEHVMYIAGDALALADHIKFRLGFVGVFTQLD